jgi:uncharacterized SAM-binding protein YcdF (DUF218 family)
MPGSRRRVCRRTAVVAFLLGIASVYAAYVAIENTTFADVAVRRLIRPDTSGTADVIVALGGSVTELCAPNFYATRRTILAVDLFLAGRANRILFTGGKPTGMDCSTAEAMAKFAQRLGVPRSSIVVESAARDTHQNATLSAPLLTAIGARRIVLVTDRLHMRRAEACFRAVGFDIERASVPVTESSNSELLYHGVRESVAWWYYSWKDWI